MNNIDKIWNKIKLKQKCQLKDFKKKRLKQMQNYYKNNFKKKKINHKLRNYANQLYK